MQDDRGYGRVQHKGHPVQAHRYVYELLRGPIGADLSLDHLCRVPACVNPDHLEPVTHAENVRRGANAQLSNDQVEQIRHLAVAGEDQAALGERFGVSRQTISAIKRGVRWRSVGAEPRAY